VPAAYSSKRKWVSKVKPHKSCKTDGFTLQKGDSMNKLDKIVDFFSKIVMGISVLILSIVTILQVIARFIFNNKSFISFNFR